MFARTSLLLLTGVLLAADAPPNAALQKELERLRIPERLTPKGKQPLFLVRAEGVQIYQAQEKDGKLQWVFQAPKAVLLDYRAGDQVGTHSRGPVWVDTKGSKLTGKVRASEPAPNAAAVPWLLLEVTNDNGGAYARVSHIQRVDTWAGLPPTAGPTKPEETREVRYQATYVFWGDR